MTQEPVELPENIGDIYEVTGYPYAGAVGYAVAYRAPTTNDPSRVCWWLDLDDSDQLEWSGNDVPEEFAAIRLIRQNPRPARRFTREVS